MTEGGRILSIDLVFHVLAPPWMQREGVTEDLPVTTWACQIWGAPTGTVSSQSGRCTRLAGEEASLALPASLWESSTIQSKNQMYRALDVGYEILLRLKRKRESDVFI